MSYTEFESSDVPNAKESGGEEEKEPPSSLQPQSYEPSQVTCHGLSVLSLSILSPFLSFLSRLPSFALLFSFLSPSSLSFFLSINHA